MYLCTQLNDTIMAKYITKKELKGIKLTDEINWLLDDINAKGDINGRYFSAWWFDMAAIHSKETNAAMDEIIWGLILNYAKANAVWYNDGTEAQLDLREVSNYVGDKLNVWQGTIIRWLRGMRPRLDVCDNFGLNALYIKIGK